jgi:hypothetical protein
MGFYDVYKAVFDAVKDALVYVPAVLEVPAHDDVPEVPGVPASGVASIKTVVLGEQFTVGKLPKAIINVEPTPNALIGPAEMGDMLDVKVNFSVVLVILEYGPKDWFTDIIKVMGDVVDAVLADRTLGGKVKDCILTGFAPGEIKFTEVKDKLSYGGTVRFQAVLWYAP